MSLSIIIPCLNEEKSIAKLINEIISVIDEKFEYEIIVVDDCSKDKTADTVEEIIKKQRFVKLIRNTNNFGYGGAFKEGLKFASKKYCTLIPGDGETNVELIVNNFLKIKNFNKIIFYNIDNDRGLTRNLISKYYTKIMNFFFKLNLKYYNGAFFYSTAELSKIKINSDGHFFLTEIIVKLIKLNPEYTELPLSLKNKTNLKSGAIKINNLISLLKDFLKVYLFNK